MENQQQPLLIFPKLDQKNIYLFIFVMCSLLRRVIPYLIEVTGFGAIKKVNFNKSCLFDMLSNFTADFLTVSYRLKGLCNKKKDTNESNTTSIKEEIIEEEDDDDDDPMKKELRTKQTEIKKNKIEQKKEMREKFFRIILIIAIIDIIAQLCLLGFSYIDVHGCTLGFDSEKCGNKLKINEDDLIFTVAINILFRYLFSRCLLTTYIYYHHKFSMILTFIGFIPLVIFNLITLLKGDQQIDASIYIILNIIMTIIYALEDVMNKIALNKLLIRPYELMFYKAFFQIIPVGLITMGIALIDYNSNSSDNISIIDYVFKNDFNWFGRIIYRLSFIIFNIFRTLSLITIIELISPNHLSILKSTEFVFLSIFSLIKNFIYSSDNDYFFYIIEIICCFILVVASFIHNEIIIINRGNFLVQTIYFKKNENEKKLNENQKEIENLVNNSIDQSNEKQ